VNVPPRIMTVPNITQNIFRLFIDSSSFPLTLKFSFVKVLEEIEKISEKMYGQKLYYYIVCRTIGEIKKNTLKIYGVKE